MTTEDDIDAELAAARARLEAFNDDTPAERMLQRLQQESPAHPLVLGYKFFVGLMAVCVALALVVLAMPLFSIDTARQLAITEARIGMPLPMVLLIMAFCTAIIGITSRFAAIARGQRSPLLPEEQKVHQSLAAEVARLSSKKRMQERGIGA